VDRRKPGFARCINYTMTGTLMLLGDGIVLDSYISDMSYISNHVHVFLSEVV
jgi:hypothetical protein